MNEQPVIPTDEAILNGLARYASGGDQIVIGRYGDIFQIETLGCVGRGNSLHEAFFDYWYRREPYGALLLVQPSRHPTLWAHLSTWWNQKQEAGQ